MEAAAASHNSPFQDITAYRALATYVYSLEGSVSEVHARLALPVPLDSARRVLQERRARSLGHPQALPFLHAAPTVALTCGDVAILEVLDSTRRNALHTGWWGDTLRLELLAWLLRDDQRVIKAQVTGCLADWSLVRPEERPTGCFVTVSEETCALFGTSQVDVAAQSFSGNAPSRSRQWAGTQERSVWSADSGGHQAGIRPQKFRWPRWVRALFTRSAGQAIAVLRRGGP